MKNRRTLLTLLAFLFLAWQAPQQAESSPGGSSAHPSPDRGLKLFEAYCVGCHGLSGQGDGPMAAALKRDFGVRPMDLSGEYMRSRSEEQIRLAVTGGGKAVHRTAYMPAWGSTLTDRQVGDLVAYIREMHSQGAPEQPPFVEVGEELELGRVLYTVHCLACHGNRGEGDGPFLQGLALGQGGVQGIKAPNLAAYRFFRERTDAQLEDLLSKETHHSGLTSGSTWWQRQMSPQEFESLIFYLRTLPLNRRDGKG